MKVVPGPKRDIEAAATGKEEKFKNKKEEKQRKVFIELTTKSASEGHRLIKLFYPTPHFPAPKTHDNRIEGKR